MDNKRRQHILMPLVLSVILAIGFILGYKLQKGTTNEQILIYPQNNKLNALLDIIIDDYVDSVNKEQLIEKAIPRVLESLDPHSVYIPAEELKKHSEPLQGNFEGIGVQFNMQRDTILIVNTISGGPSEKVGILPGDRIITINDSVFAGVNRSSDDVIKSLKGKKGTKVNVGIKRRGIPELLHFTITRDEIPLYSIDVSYMLTANIGYVKISRFARTTYDEFAEAVNKLREKGMKKIILDLRENGGGYLDAATNVADEFLKEGELIVYTKGRNRKRQEYYATDNNLCQNLEVAVLIDEWSASASEIVAGAIQDNDRGRIVGRRSFGKGLVQEPTYFKDGSALRLTIARYYTPTGRCIQRPYTNGREDYYHDILHRMEHGELQEKDSIKFTDSLKYKTKGGRIVYGGGGIMPDIFVPVDTIDYSDYLKQVTNKGLVNRFTLQYTDLNRDKLSEFKTAKKLQEYLESQNILQKFLVFSKKQGINPEAKDVKKSKQILEVQIKALIARNILDNEGYYPIIREIDKSLQKAIEALK